MAVRRFQDLEVWQLANQLHMKIVQLDAISEARRDFKFFDQLLGASRSVSANIAEGFGRYRPAEFSRFLHYARGSVLEVQAHLIEAEARAFIASGTLAEMRALSDRIAGALTMLIKSLRSSRAPGS